MVRYFLFWLPMILLAFANATLRELLLNNFFPLLLSQQINTFTLAVLCSLYSWLIYPFLAIHTGKQALCIGLLWTMLTVAFEFGLGLSVGRSWHSLVQQYHFASGQLWPLFLVVLFFAPYIVYRLRNKGVKKSY